MSKLGKVNKKIWFIISTIIVLVIVSFFMLSKERILVLKENHVVMEYGQHISDDPNQYLKLKDKNLVSNIKIDNNFKIEENHNYPKIGNYKMTFSYKKEKVTVNIEVKDTTKPTFNDCNSIEFVKGTDFNYAEFIKAEDLQEVTYDYDTSNVNKDTVGEYTVKVTATDKSNNKAEKEIKVKVLDIDPTNNDVQTSITENGDVVVNVAEKPKETTNNTSSNSTSNTTSNNTNTNANTNNSKPSSNTQTPPDKTYTYEDEANNPNHQHYSSFISPLFNTQAERDKWAEDYLLSDENFYNTKYSGYVGARCSCGKSGVTDFY